MKPHVVVASAIAIYMVFGFSLPTITAQTASVPDPFPPRMFLTSGFIGSSAHTLPNGNGYFAVGYAGAEFVAQWSDKQTTSLPFIVHGAYGVTDYFTLGLGSGLWRYGYDYGYGDEESYNELVPYLAPQVRMYQGEFLTASVRGTIIFPSEDVAKAWFYGTSLELSTNLAKRATGHLSLGITGIVYRGEQLDNDNSDSARVLKLGQDVSVFMSPKSHIKVFGELRVISGGEGATLFTSGEGVSIFTGGARVLTNALGIELGIAKWFEDGFELRPLASASYRF